MTEQKSPRTGDSIFVVDHASGLKIMIYPKAGYSSAYAVFGTRYGSINTQFKADGELVSVPDGIAHFLEHKMFESEEGDAFAKYAKTGASANAFTSFDQTCYLFSCTENFEESFEILLDLVQSPYFTEQTVQKEQGIIGQEIRMYDDSPDWRVMVNLLNALYHNHPVKIDIAGTVESIAEITAEKLYQCYRAYYNLHNMVLCVAGNVDPEEVVKIADRKLKPVDKVTAENVFPQEPESIVQERIEQRLAVAVPMFQLGFKETAGNQRVSPEKMVQTAVLLEVLASKGSPLYEGLLEKGLINTSSFGCEYFEGPGYASVVFAGESRNPDEAAAIIRKACEKLHETGVSQEQFQWAKKAVYGRTLAMLNNTESIANAMVSQYFAGYGLFDYINKAAEVTLDQVNARLAEQLDGSHCALSVVLPQE